MERNGKMSVVPVANQAAQIPKRPVKTALHQAVLDCRIHQVRLLVDRHGGNVDAKDVFGRTPLMLACLLDSEDDGYRMTKIFLRAGAYVNIRDHMARTALHYACMKGKTVIVERLLKEEAVAVNAPDNDGNTPLIHAALSGSPRLVDIVVELLNKFGLSVDGRNVMGYTALLLACKYGHFVSAITLIQTGHAQPELRDNEFFLNAHEWVERSRDLHSVFAARRSRSTCGAEQPRFAREQTMYRRAPSGHVCHHFKTPHHPLGESLDAALRLPAVFSHARHLDNMAEVTLDGLEAKEVLCREIDDAIANPKTRGKSRQSTGVSTRGHSTRSERARFASTPKLLALSARSHTAMVPDMRTLFNLYSDQHQERVERVERGSGAVSAPVGALRSTGGTGGDSGKLPGIQVHFELAPLSAQTSSLELQGY